MQNLYIQYCVEYSSSVFWMNYESWERFCLDFELLSVKFIAFHKNTASSNQNSSNNASSNALNNINQNSTRSLHSLLESKDSQRSGNSTPSNDLLRVATESFYSDSPSTPTAQNRSRAAARNTKVDIKAIYQLGLSWTKLMWPNETHFEEGLGRSQFIDCLMIICQ